MNLKELKKRKHILGYTDEILAEMTGLSPEIIKSYFEETKDIPSDILIELESVLMPHRIYPSAMSDSISAVQEALGAYGMQKEPGEYTADDFFHLPEDLHAELIDGVFYRVTAPTPRHQAITGHLLHLFLHHIFTHDGTCQPFTAPIAVQLDEDDKTIVQPDVMIVCDRDKIRKDRIFGAPDLIIEVLSPSSRKRDMQYKLFKYGEAGVREYWIIDPEIKTIIQYDLAHLNPPVIYSFADTIPVLIWEGECNVNFREIYEAIAFLYESPDEM